MILVSLNDAAGSDMRRFFDLLRLPPFNYPFFRFFFGRFVVRRSPSWAQLQTLLRDIHPPAPQLKRVQSFPGFTISR